MVRKQRCYETLYIVRPDLDEEGLDRIKNRLNETISNHEGEIYKEEEWDRRDLAYEIKDYARGVYQILVYKAFPPVVAEMERSLRFFSDDVLRFMTVKIDEEQARKASETDKTATEAGTEEAETGETRVEQ